jgi:hypothetical protein
MEEPPDFDAWALGLTAAAEEFPEGAAIDIVLLILMTAEL